MEKSIFSFSFSLSILLLNCVITLCFGASILNSTTDKHALVSFKNSIIFDPNAILSTNWSENTSICYWIGVTCGVEHHRVTALNLSGYDLAGTVAPNLGNLTFLRYLDISSNNFTGFLPFELSKLRRLKVMNVGVNSFTGEIPTWLGNFPLLEQLYLSNNTFSELGMEGKVSTNGDVYSFGIMLLEMFTGKKPMDDMFGGEMSLKEWVSDALQENAATQIVAPALLSRKDQHFSAKEQCVSLIFKLAMKCLAVSAEERINMIEAAATLHKIKATIVAGTERRRP